MGRFPSGQREQTVNLPLLASVVRIHPCPPYLREWRNWQTRMIQVHVYVRTCRFKSCFPHSVKGLLKSELTHWTVWVSGGLHLLVYKAAVKSVAIFLLDDFGRNCEKINRKIRMTSGLEQVVQTYNFSDVLSDDTFSPVSGTFLRKMRVFHS